ncbi:MAG: hypothetical protein IJ467_05250 [Bacteroidaceae bacterium]|nr:hypothetical protein [Bacteroidaceae bacterium]
MDERALKDEGREGLKQSPAKEGDENGLSNGKKMTLARIFLGDFLLNDFLLRQAVLIALVVVYTVFYISNRYSCQQEMIEIDRLRKQLVDIKYDALTRSSELTERTRQSHIEEYVSVSGSDLQISTNPPYVIE